MKFIGQLLSSHLARYPAMELLDIYKLLHQAALGNSHAVTTLASANERLRSETQAMGEGPEEPLWDPISPDGRLGRVHLRPYVAAGFALEALANAHVGTAESCPPAPEKLVKFCGCLGDLASQGILPFDAGEVVGCFAEIAEQGYPAVRHTPTYRTHYRPAYRVVDIELLPLLRP